MSMTRQHYEFVADVMAKSRMTTPSDVWATTLNHYIEGFAADNPRFDEERFRAACFAEHSVKARVEPFLDATMYDMQVVVAVAKGQTAPSADEFERIATAALKDKLNTPTTPYYVASVTVTARAEG